MPELEIMSHILIPFPHFRTIKKAKEYQDIYFEFEDAQCIWWLAYV